MIELNPARLKTVPFRHQLAGARALLTYPAFALFDEMRLGKSKQVIDAACALADAGELDTVLVIAPAGVRGVWAHPDAALGEVRKHAWVGSRVAEFHSPRRGVYWRERWRDAAPLLDWWVTNYEFIRNTEHRRILAKALRERRVMLVLDESSFIKSPRAQQTRACLALAPSCARRVILNGTPVTRSPLDLYAQMRFLSPRILGAQNFYQFRYRYAVMGGWQQKQVVAYQNLEELRELVRPYCLRRTLEDCFDLPAELPPQHREVPLTPETWRHYQSVKKEMLAWLDRATPRVVASTAAVKALRLAQLTGGYLGGLEVEGPPLAVGREKLDETVRLLEESERPTVVWCRFRAERERLAHALADGGVSCYQLYGGQPARERELARAAFGHASAAGFRVLLAQPQAGGFGLDLSAAGGIIYYSRDFNAGVYWQSRARVQHPEKKTAVGFTYLLATGPNGQRTVDHLIERVLAERQDLARWTAARWRKELEEE